MVQIQQYIAGGSLQSAGQLETPVDDSFGRAVEGFGNTVGNIAATLQDRQDQRDNFKNNAMYDKFKIERAVDLDNAAQQMPEGGTDFTKTYLETSFKPKADAFLATLPEKDRARFSTLLEVEEARYGAKAAEVEQKEVLRYQTNTVAATQEQLANGINIEPERYEELYKTGVDQIDQMTAIGDAGKAELKKGWEKMAQTAHLDRILATNPQEVLRKLGADAAQWSSGTKFTMLKSAVIRAETGGEANPATAVSSAGAVGIMQVMPGTASDIAKEIKDPNFPTTGNDEHIKSYLSNPKINEMYGDFYLQKQLKAFGGDTEAALIAYNAGPGVAQKWLESGKNDDMLPAETIGYKNKIMKDLAPDVAKIPPQDVQLVWTRGAGLGQLVPGDSDLSKVSPILQDRVKTAFATLGIKEVRINSGHRDASTNKRVGGAQGSQHLEGNALDIDVKGMPLEQRKELIRSLSAAGVTGLGIYANAIHVDIGARRAWGADYHGQSVPKWASGVVAEHMSGTAAAPPNKGVNSQYSAIDYSQRQKYISAADNAVAQQSNANTPSMQVARQQTRQSMMNDLASHLGTGQGAEGFNEEDVATYLGADDYNKYVTQRELNDKIYTSKQGIATLTPSELEAKAAEFEPVAGSMTFAQDQEVQKAVIAEVNRITSLRAKDPAKAAEEMPAVKAAKQEALTPKQDGTFDPQAVQNYVRAVLSAQDTFNIPPNEVTSEGKVVVNRAPIEKSWAYTIGKQFSAVPPITGGNVDKVRENIGLRYAAMKETFGEYADDVIIYAMSEYNGIDKPTAKLITGLMLSLQNGRDPFEVSKEVTKVEKGLIERITGYFTGVDDESDISAEEQRRIARDKQTDD